VVAALIDTEPVDNLIMILQANKVLLPAKKEAAEDPFA
jgi:hypothetical protein